MSLLATLIVHFNCTCLFIILICIHFDTIAAAKAATPPQPTLNYGTFINNVINFLIVAFCVFLVVKQVNRFAAAPAPLPTTKDCPQCAIDDSPGGQALRSLHDAAGMRP